MVMASKTTQRGTEFNSQDPFLLDTLWLPHLHCGICVSHTKEIKYKKKKIRRKKERKGKCQKTICKMNNENFLI